MSRTSELHCSNCDKTLAKSGGIKCPRCGQVNGFGGQHTDVSLASDVNIIHTNGRLIIRVPRTSFNNSCDGEPNPEVEIIRKLLKENGVKFEEFGSHIAAFEVKTWRYLVTSWVDATSHGFRMAERETTGVGGNDLLEFYVKGTQIIFSSRKPARPVLAIGDSVLAELAK